MERILVTGATGQIGSELTPYLRDRYGSGNVVAAGHRSAPNEALRDSGPYITLEVRDQGAVDEALAAHGVDTVFHLAAVLSASAEERPREAWDINMAGLLNVLEAARTRGCAVFFPSSIGAFGPASPAEGTPQDTIQRPRTMYGVSKVSGELLCDYYFRRHRVDTRGLRYPGLISHEAPPGGGTTDYAVEIFHAALTEGRYTCPLREGTRLDMMYMPDALRAAVELMEADPGKLVHRNAFNVTAMSVGPEDLFRAIRESLPHFTMDYRVDPLRQSIADGWPRHMDDSAARREWGWNPRFDLAATVTDMLAHLPAGMGNEGPPPEAGAGE